MAERGSYIDDQEQFFIFRDRSPLMPRDARTVLKEAISRLGLDCENYDFHMMRAGRATDLIKFGYSVEQVKSLGRWKLNAVYRYIKK